MLDRLAKHLFEMTIGEGWEIGFSTEVTSRNVVINLIVELLEGIGKTLVMPARIRGRGSGFR